MRRLDRDRPRALHDPVQQPDYSEDRRIAPFATQDGYSDNFGSWVRPGRGEGALDEAADRGPTVRKDGEKLPRYVLW